MPGLNGCNRKRPNIHRITRQKSAPSRQIKNKARASARANLIATPQHIRMLRSNPQANLTMSNKKVKKLDRVLRLEAGEPRDLTKGAKGKFIEAAKRNEIECAEQGMEVTASGEGTCLGGPM